MPIDGALAITGVNPPSASIGGGAPLTITGRGFQSGATVTIGGTVSNAEFRSETELQVTAPSAVYAPCGPTVVRVVNPDQSAAESRDVFRYVINTVAFASRPPITAGSGYVSLSTGDWNGDGNGDVLAVKGNTGMYTYFMGDGRLGFQAIAPPSMIETYNRTIGVNLRNSKQKDYILYNTAAANFIALAGDPLADFKVIGSRQSIQARYVYEYPHSGAASDIVVVTNPLGELQFFKNNGSGVLGPAPSSPTINDVSMAGFGDVDGDQILDLITISQSGTQTLNYYKGTSFSSYTKQTAIPLTAPRQLLVADIDNDGKAEVLVISAGIGGSTMNYYRVVSQALVMQPDTFMIDANPVSILKDLNCDNLPELITNQAGTGLINYYRNISSNGDVTFGTAKALFDLPTIAIDSGAFGAFNTDARQDLAILTTTGNIILLVNESE